MEDIRKTGFQVRISGVRGFKGGGIQGRISEIRGLQGRISGLRGFSRKEIREKGFQGRISGVRGDIRGERISGGGGERSFKEGYQG
jgi:hypothetical protein